MIQNKINRAASGKNHRRFPVHQNRIQDWLLTLLSCCACLTLVFQQTTQAQKPAAKKSVIVPAPQKWPKTAVYLPVDQLDAVIARDRSGVLLPRKQYEALKKQAETNTGGVELPQTNAVIYAADYQAKVVDHQIIIDATISFRQFQQKLTLINLPLNGLAVESATVDQQPAMIARSSGKIQVLQLFNQRPGEHQLKLQMSAALNSVGSDQVAQFQLLPQVASQFKMEIPAKQHLVVNDLKVKSSTPDGQKGVYEFPIGGEARVSLKITEQAREQTNDSLIFARSGIGVSVSPGKVAWQAQTALNIYGQALDRVVLSVPQTLEIVSVESTGLESWELNDSVKDSSRTEITLNYRQPIEGERQIICRGVMTTETEKSWKVPDLAIEKVNSHVGSVLIRYPLGVRLQVERTNNVRRKALPQPIPRKGAPERRLTNPGLDFDFWQQKFNITLVTQEKRSEVQMAASTVVNINEQGMDLQLVTTVESLFAPLFEFQMKVPAEWTILGATLQNKPVDWKESSREAGIKFIRLPFSKALSANTEAKIVVTAHRDLDNWPPDAESQLLELPKIELPQAKILEGSLVINADKDWDLVPSSLTNLEPMQERIPNMRFGYQYQDNNYAGSLSVSRKPLQLAAHHLQYVRLDPTTLFSHFEATLNVERGSYRSLMVALPENVGTDLQFRLIKTAGKIIEQVADEPKNGVRVWTLKIDRRLSGKQILMATVEQPRKKGEVVKIPQLQIMSADRQYGEVAFEAEGDQRLKIQATGLRGQSLTAIDAAELPMPVAYQPRERIVAAYRFVGIGHEIQAEATRFDQTAVPTAIAQQLTLKSVLGHAGEVQNESLVSFSAVGIQALQVVLPEQGELLSALVNGTPVEVRNTGKAFIVPISSDTQTDGSHTLKLLYDANRAPVHEAKQFSQTPPQLAVIDGTGKTQPLKILNQSWTILYPDELLITASSGDFVPDLPIMRPGMIEYLRQHLALLSPGDFIWRIFCVFIVTGIILIGAYVFRKGSMLDAVSLIAGFLILCVLFVLMLPSAQKARSLQSSIERSPGEASVPANSPSGDLSLSTAGRSAQEAMDSFQATPALPDLVENEVAPKPAAKKEDAFKTPLLVQPGDLAEKPMIEKSKRRIEGGQVFERRPQDGPRISITKVGETEFEGMAAGESATDIPARALGGRLSVEAPLPEPAGFRSLAFQYYGEPQQKPLALTVSLLERQKSYRIYLTVIAGMLWLCWFLRGISGWRKSLIALVGVLVPIACCALFPVWFQEVLDGILSGTLLSITFWGLDWFVRQLRIEFTGLQSRTDKTKATIASLILLGTLMSDPAASFAQQKPVIPPRPPQDLIVPYEVGSDPLNAQRIFLSRDEFKKLWNAAHPGQPVDQATTSLGAVSQALYAAQIKPGAEPGQAVVHVEGRLVIHTVGKQPVTLPVPLGPAAISSALLDGKPATLLTHPQNRFNGKKKVAEHFYSLVISEPGLHLLDLKFDLPAQQTGPAGSFQIDLNPVASGRLTLELPDKISVLSVTGTRASYRKQTAGEKATLELPVDQGGEIQIAWRPAEERGAIQGIVHCQSTQATIIQDAGLELQSTHQYRIRQGQINQASLKISEDLRIQSITGPDVGGWEIVGSGDARRIKIFLRRDVKETTTVNVVAFQPLSIGKQTRAVNLPQIVPEEITNETGTVGVYAQSQFQVRPDEIAGAIQIDTGQFRNPATSSPQLKVAGANLSPQWAYRFSRRPLTLRFSVSRRQPEKQAIAEHAVLVSPRKMSLSSRVRYQLKGIPESTFVMELPEEYLVLNVNAEGLDDWYIIEQNADDMRVLVFEFKELKTNQVEIVFEGVIPRDANQGEAEVMMPTPLEVSSVRSDLAIWCDESLVARAPELNDWRSISAADLSPELKAQQSRLPQFAFRSTAELPEWIKLALTPAQPGITANSLVMTTVGNVSVSHTVAIRWSIQGAATSELSFTTPAWLGEHLDFRGASIRQVDKRVIGGSVVQWTIYLQDSVEGSYFITADATLSPPASGQIEIPQVRVMDTSGKVDPQTTELEIQQHFLMLVNHSWARLSLLNQDSLISVDRQEVPLVINESLANQAMELARIIPNGKPPLYQTQQFQADQGAAAAVNMAELTTVLAHDGSWKTHADYRIRNRSRQFLAVRLPDKTQVLSAFVKGIPTAPVLLKGDAAEAKSGSAIYLLALPKTSAADLSFSVNLILSGRLPAALPQGTFRLKSADIDLQPPQVVIPAEDAEYGIPVAQTKWSVYVPNEYTATALLDDPRTNMTPVNGNGLGDTSLTSMVKDVENLYSVYTGNKSDRVRSRAIKNLKQLELKLDQNTTTYTGKQKERLKEQIGEIQQREIQRQAQQKKLLGLSKGQGKDGVTDFDSEETFNQLVIGNSATLFDANRDAYQQESRDLSGKFQSGKASESKSQLKGFYFRKEIDKKGGAKGKGVPPQAVDSRALRRQQSIQNANDFSQAPRGMQQQAEMPNAAPSDFSDQIQTEPSASMGGFGGGVRFGTREFKNQPMSEDGKNNVWQQLNDVDEALADAYTPDIKFGHSVPRQGFGDKAGQSQMMEGTTAQGQQAAWTQAGGISLHFDIPLHGQKLVFSKINGQPKLALSVRPENTYQFVGALLWTVIWTLVLIGLIWCVSRNLQSAVAQKGLGILLMLAGLTGWLLLSGMIAGLAICCFIVGAIVLAYLYVKQAA
ncbi:hypothetical protein Pan241w_54820 [Gimesia alba]|uniref:Uncharacterized protein n=1 Tax=Gimesia alba TaxID=2527973 RepID=A0A517RNF5_9PLAN|nr:hypothetical protein [Gimesia alba]QDT45362.1 hypothetical protein Pan241w_54820 [Gimesia alba]